MGRYALLVGVSGYTDQRFRQLRSPARDVARLAELLRDPDIGQYDEVRTLTRPTETTGRALQVAIAELTADRAWDDTVLLYLSCHGVKDETGQLYFAARDTSDGLLAATGVASAYVRERLERCIAGTRVQLLDCCFSAAFAAGFASKSGDRPLSNEDPGRGYVVITATNHYEYAWEGTSVVPEDPTTSVFTNAVLDALTDTTADRDGDGWISDRDLYEYVHREVRARTRGTQTPTHFAYDLQGTVVVAKAAGATPTASPPPPMPTASTAVRPADPDNEMDAARPGRFVFSAHDYIDVAGLRGRVDQGELSVDGAIAEAWQQFRSYISACATLAGRDADSSDTSKVIRFLLGDVADPTVVTLSLAGRAAVNAVRRKDAEPDPTRLGLRRLDGFLADLTSATREIDAVFDLAPPVFRDLLHGIGDETRDSACQERAADGYREFGAYVDRVARAWGIPPPKDIEENQRKELSYPDSAVAWLSEKSADPDVASLVRESKLLRQRITGIGNAVALARYLDDLATLAGELEEHARTVQRRRLTAPDDKAPVPQVTAAPARTFTFLTTPAPKTQWWDGMGDWVGGAVAIGALCLVATLIYSVVYTVGPTRVGFERPDGDTYRVERYVHYIPGKTRFLWELGEDAEVTTKLRPTEPTLTIVSLSGHIRLGTGAGLCRDASVEWKISGKGFEVTRTSHVKNGEAASVELDDIDIGVEKPGNEVTLTAQRTDSEPCKTTLEWTRPGFDELTNDN